MYKRYLEPGSKVEPTKYIIKKLKLSKKLKLDKASIGSSKNENQLKDLLNVTHEDEGVLQCEEELESDNLLDSDTCAFYDCIDDFDSNNISDSELENGNREYANQSNDDSIDDFYPNNISDSEQENENRGYANLSNDDSNDDFDSNNISNDSESENGDQGYANQSTDDIVYEDMDNDDFFNFTDDDVIHPNLNCKTADAILMILEFFLHHHLTWVALSDLLHLFHTMLGSNSTLPKTKHLFKKIFGSNKHAIFHFYCQNCNLYVDTLENLKVKMEESGGAKMNCSNCQHEVTLNKMNNGHFFIHLPLRNQIYKKITKNPEILHFDHTASPNNSIRDFYDGDLYKDLRRKVGDCTLVTLTMNTDGVRVFKSKSKSSLWPIQMFMNEVSTTKRFKLGNIILNGIWFGKSPDVSMYLKHLINELNELDENKIKVTVYNKLYDVTVRGFFMTADTIARCKLMKMKQFNGDFGCTYCLHPGERSDGSTTSKYPQSTCDYPLRTHASTLTLIADFLKSGEGSSGLKGISPLIAIKDYDLIRGTVIDYMHCVLLGVVYLLLTLWFNSTNHFYNYYIIPMRADIVNKNLMNIKPLKSFAHRPRPLADREDWKANELRNWLLYYAIPCLKGTLKDAYFKHFTLLSEAIFIFLKTNISTIDFKRASDNLKKFVDDFEKLYGRQNMMYNVHLLLHLAKCVRECGPLWVYSNFNFESNNGSLVRHVKGTTDVEKQILAKYFYNNILESLKDKNETARNYIDGIRSGNVNNSKKIGSITLFGKPRKQNLDSDEQLILKTNSILEYSKLFFSNDLFYSTSYKRAKTTNDTIVLLKDGIFGQITRIYEDAGTVYILLKKFQVEAVPHFPIHLKKVVVGNLDFVRADMISQKCILINTLKETYLSCLPNRVESD